MAVYGLIGSGTGPLARALYGIDPADSGTITVNGQPVSLPTPAGRRPDRHRPAPGQPQGPGRVRDQEHRLQHLGRPPRICSGGCGCGSTARREQQVATGLHQADRHQDAGPADRRQRPVRRQPAEGRAGPPAGRAPRGPGPGGADPGRRRRRQGGDPQADPRPGRPGHGRPGRLLGPAGGAGAGRPGAGRPGSGRSWPPSAAAPPRPTCSPPPPATSPGRAPRWTRPAPPSPRRWSPDDAVATTARPRRVTARAIEGQELVLLGVLAVLWLVLSFAVDTFFAAFHPPGPAWPRSPRWRSSGWG